MSHANAALTPIQRLRVAKLIVDEGWPVAHAATFFHVAWPTAKRWSDRYRVMGAAGMQDRSSRPYRSPNRTSPELVRKIVHLRWKQRLGPVGIAGRLNLPASTVHAVLVRCRLTRLRHVDVRTGDVTGLTRVIETNAGKEVWRGARLRPGSRVDHPDAVARDREQVQIAELDGLRSGLEILPGQAAVGHVGTQSEWLGPAGPVHEALQIPSSARAITDTAHGHEEPRGDSYTDRIFGRVGHLLRIQRRTREERAEQRQ